MTKSPPPLRLASEATTAQLALPLDLHVQQYSYSKQSSSSESAGQEREPESPEDGIDESGTRLTIDAYSLFWRIGKHPREAARETFVLVRELVSHVVQERKEKTKAEEELEEESSLMSREKKLEPRLNVSVFCPWSMQWEALDGKMLVSSYACKLAIRICALIDSTSSWTTLLKVLHCGESPMRLGWSLPFGSEDCGDDNDQEPLSTNINVHALPLIPTAFSAPLESPSNPVVETLLERTATTYQQTLSNPIPITKPSETEECKEPIVCLQETTVTSVEEVCCGVSPQATREQRQEAEEEPLEVALAAKVMIIDDELTEYEKQLNDVESISNRIIDSPISSPFHSETESEAAESTVNDSCTEGTRGNIVMVDTEDPPVRESSPVRVEVELQQQQEGNVVMASISTAAAPRLRNLFPMSPIVQELVNDLNLSMNEIRAMDQRINENAVTNSIKKADTFGIRSLAGTTVEILRVFDADEKLGRLQETLQSFGPGRVLLIVANVGDSIRFVEEITKILHASQFPAYPVHRRQPPHVREANIAKLRRRSAWVLVTNEEGGRKLSLDSLDVDHVVFWGWPKGANPETMGSYDHFLALFRRLVQERDPAAAPLQSVSILHYHLEEKQYLKPKGVGPCFIQAQRILELVGMMRDCL